MNAPIRPKDRDAIIQSLRAGVVPRRGQHLIQVGRSHEVEALVADIDRVADGGSSFRFVIGEYGAGKTFFLNLVRTIAMERKLVVANADLNPDRRLQASGGQARSLYAELMRNLATRTKPYGGALPGAVEKFVATAKSEAEKQGVATEQAAEARDLCRANLSDNCCHLARRELRDQLHVATILVTERRIGDKVLDRCEALRFEHRRTRGTDAFHVLKWSLQIEGQDECNAVQGRRTSLVYNAAHASSLHSFAVRGCDARADPAWDHRHRYVTRFTVFEDSKRFAFTGSCAGRNHSRCL